MREWFGNKRRNERYRRILTAEGGGGAFSATHVLTVGNLINQYYGYYLGTGARSPSTFEGTDIDYLYATSSGTRQLYLRLTGSAQAGGWTTVEWECEGLATVATLTWSSTRWELNDVATADIFSAYLRDTIGEGNDVNIRLEGIT